MNANFVAFKEAKDAPAIKTSQDNNGNGAAEVGLTSSSDIRGFKVDDDEGSDKIIFIDLSELRAAGLKFEN